jgi:ketosteroid isomerase-like protein
MISHVTLSLLAALASATQAAEDPEVAAVIARADQANAHLMRGDIDGYRRQIRTAPDFVLMDPFGGIPTGNPKSDEHWRRIGRFFREGRDAEFQVIGAYRSDNLIVLVANERAHVAVGALPAQDWALRVTMVFRRDNGEWHLVHRHADPLALGISLEEAGRITLGKAAGGGDR